MPTDVLKRIPCKLICSGIFARPSGTQNLTLIYPPLLRLLQFTCAWKGLSRRSTSLSASLFSLAVLPQPRESAASVLSSLVSCLAGPPHLTFPSPAPSGQFSIPTSTRNSATELNFLPAAQTPQSLPHLPPRLRTEPDPQQVGVYILSVAVGRFHSAPVSSGCTSFLVRALKVLSSPAPEFLRGCRA